MAAEHGLEPEEGYFPADFKEYMERELKWSRLEISAKPDGYAYSCPFEFWEGIKWVFWSRQDDYPDRPLYSDNFGGSIPDAGGIPEVSENIRLALHKMVLCPCLDHALVQFWAPSKTSEGRTLLRTQYQPFGLGRTDDTVGRKGLCEYRMKMCREYNNCFYADAKSGEEQLGLPARVFLHELSEFQDVQFYSLNEYPQRDLALRCCISESWALPVIERSSQTCVGVLEILHIRDQPPYGYSHLFDIFQEFGLQCLGGCKDSEEYDENEDKDEVKNKALEGNEEDKDKNKALAVAFKELKMVLDSVCKIYKLPLAMTWVPCHTCNHLLRGQHLSMDKDFFKCADYDVYFPYYIKSTLKKCHFRKGQVTGRIHPFPTLSYCWDVKQFSITEYPLVAYVRQTKLSGCFTMCLQSSQTGSELYVLEFFLPPSSKDDENILSRLSLILRTMQENLTTFKLACSQELGGGLSVEVIDFPNGQRSHSIQMIEAIRFFPTLEPLKDGGGILQLGQPDQPSMDAVDSRMNVVSEAQNYNLPSFEPLQNRKVAMQLDSSDQLSMDPANNGQNVVTAKRNIHAVTSSEEGRKKTQKREHSKTGVRIEVSLEDILKCSKMSRDNAARKLEVSISTLKRVCRGYGIHRWPPRNIKKVHSSGPLPFDNQEQTPRLSSDWPSNQVSASVVRIKPAFQDGDLVTIRAKYENHMIKFRLSLLSTLEELHQEVAKRLNLEAGSYYVKYKDEEDELILIACDDDLQDCARHFRSVGKTSIVVQLEPKQTSQLGVGNSIACVRCSNGLDP